MTCLAFAEIRNLYLTDAEQARRLAAIAAGIDATSKGLEKTALGIDATAKDLTALNASSQAQFTLMMKQFEGVVTLQRKTLKQLETERKEFSQQLAGAPLASLSATELSWRARVVARQLRDFLDSYLIADREIDIRHYDYLEGHQSQISQKQIDDWNSEERKRRTALRSAYEAQVSKLILDADRIRVELLKRIGQTISTEQQADRVARAWFGSPSGPPGISFLYKLGENADYLDDLARKMIDAQPKP